MLYFHTKFYMPSLSDPSVNTTKRALNLNFASPPCCFYCTKITILIIA